MQAFFVLTWNPAYIYFMEEQETTFAEWMSSLTVSDVVTQLSLIVFTIFIIVLVVRAFRNKPSI